MADQWNFATNLQGAPAAVNAPNLLQQDATIANTNLTNAQTAETGANTQHIGAVTAGQVLSNQQAQLLLDQRQASIDAWQKVQAAHELNNTPKTNVDASGQPVQTAQTGGGLPTDSSTGQATSGAGTAPAPGNNSPTSSHISDSAYNSSDAMDQYWDQLNKSGKFTPAEIQTQRLAWQNNMSDATKKAADAEQAIADVQEKKATAQKSQTEAAAASAEYLGTSLLPVKRALDKGDITTANAMYTAAVGHVADLAVHQATEAAGRPLTGPEAAQVRAQAASQFPPLFTAGQKDPNGNVLPPTVNGDALGKISTIVGASKAGQEYQKTQNELASGQSTRALQAQEIAASKQNVINSTVDTAVRQGTLTAAAGKDMVTAASDAQMATGLVRNATQLKEADALLANIRDTYGSDFAKGRDVVFSTLSPRYQAIIQALAPEVITGRGADAKVSLSDLVKTVNAKMGTLDVANLASERVRGAMGSNQRAQMAAEQGGQFSPLDSNEAFETKRRLREEYADSVGLNAQRAAQTFNNQSKLLVKAAKQGSPDLDIKPEDFTIEGEPYKPGRLTSPIATPKAVDTPNGGKAKVVAGKTRTYNPTTGTIE